MSYMTKNSYDINELVYWHAGRKKRFNNRCGWLEKQSFTLINSWKIVYAHVVNSSRIIRLLSVFLSYSPGSKKEKFNFFCPNLIFIKLGCLIVSKQKLAQMLANLAHAPNKLNA
ncbi:hypothetical protein BpHYR1_011358 [Brachionus plicatilis]|uniref:Uncharacterized protein n=1 Tax=Brachionus plicatilis TaxID=10195 RepID=A0A3M7SM65_BRAPC|nr:hypothetical protein BpHYR1_011358 [Brachionus plicatilis]